MFCISYPTNYNKSDNNRHSQGFAKGICPFFIDFIQIIHVFPDSDDSSGVKIGVTPLRDDVNYASTDVIRLRGDANYDKKSVIRVRDDTSTSITDTSGVKISVIPVRDDGTFTLKEELIGLIMIHFNKKEVFIYPKKDIIWLVS